MEITLTPELEAALNETARQKGISPRDLALEILRERFLAASPPLMPSDEWERTVLELAKDCGVSLSHLSLSSEGLYE